MNMIWINSKINEKNMLKVYWISNKTSQKVKKHVIIYFLKASQHKDCINSSNIFNAATFSFSTLTPVNIKRIHHNLQNYSIFSSKLFLSNIKKKCRLTLRKKKKKKKLKKKWLNNNFRRLFKRKMLKKLRKQLNKRPNASLSPL